MWIFDDQEEPKEWHFVFVVTVDGFPRNTSTGSTEVLIQTLNLVGGVNQIDFNRVLAVADLPETSPEMDAVVRRVEKQMSDLQTKAQSDDGFWLVLDVPKTDEEGDCEIPYVFERRRVKITVDFVFKVDLKYVSGKQKQITT